jgi:DNA recombination protein RmuC
MSSLMWGLLGLLSGFVLGIGVSFFLRIMHGRSAKELAREMLEQTDSARKEQVDSLLNTMKESFGNLSLTALSRSTEEFLKLAESKLTSEREANVQELDAKKGLIDQQLGVMTGELKRVGELVRELENDRKQKFGQLSESLRAAGEQTAHLMKTTGLLREALASAKVRGQWGERMAEDILRLAGFIEHVNYEKQKTIESSGSRPDFTFFLPRELKLNMDVKFPYDKYIRYLENESEQEKNSLCIEFLKDVRARIKEITGREYINPEQNTVDYVLLFIPNEQIYSFIHEKDSAIIDDAIKNKVVLCSPMTLFAVLSIIRQAVDNFALEKTSHEIISLLGQFKKQWSLFIAHCDKLGKSISVTQKEYDALITTRRRMLERPLNKIEELRTRQGIAIADENDQVADSEPDRE